MADQKSNAGNLGDLIKHMLLVEIVKLYSARTAGWTYFETHAGYYTYPVEQLRNQEGDWSGERKWSLGVIANADSKSIGDFGQSVQSYVRSGFYPGSIRWVEDSLAETDCEYSLQGCDLKPEVVASYPRDSKQVSVSICNGYEQATKLNTESTLLFCDPFWKKDSAEQDMKEVKRLSEKFQTMVVWYPINNTTLLRRFVDWRKSSGFSYIEFEYEHYEVGKGWAGQDMRGAGILLHGFNASTLQSLMEHVTKFQALFCGRNEGSRDITLRMTVSLASPSDHPRTSTSS